MTVFAPSSYRTPADARGRHGHHNRPGCDPLVAERRPCRHGDVDQVVRSQIRAGDGRAALLGFGQMLPLPRMQRRSSPPKASTPPFTTCGSHSARPCHDRRHRRSRLCRLDRGRPAWVVQVPRCETRSASAAPRAEFECSACPPNTSRTTIPTSFMPDSGSTARASPPACLALIVLARQAGGLRCSRGSRPARDRGPTTSVISGTASKSLAECPPAGSLRSSSIPGSHHPS